MSKRPLGIGLLSGGLDSALACLVLRDAGADVQCLHFFTGFCVTGHNSRVGRRDRPIMNHALQVAAEMEVPVDLVDISEEYLPMVLNPKHGYGKNMNPCIDCRVFMLRKAKERMDELGADFVFTGEVIGQRPKSQMKGALRTIEKEVGLEGRLVRPLSARLLEPTEIEASGRVDRTKLYDIYGRGRKTQIELAEKYGIKDFMQPAGGCCFLTDQNYTKKFRDVIEHTDGTDLTVEDIFILGVGRHFRLSRDLKVIVGRDEVENNFLSHYRRDHWSVQATEFQGPTAIVMGEMSVSDVDMIAAMVARYCDGKREPAVDVRFELGSEERVVTAAPATDDVLDQYRV
jgi:tRNA U34 2-thiouridine synthase MnmA/TrmU